MHLRPDFWRLSLFAALGFCPNACGGATDQDTSTSTSDTLIDKQQPTGASACGQSTQYPQGQTPADLAVCENELVHRPSRDVQCSSVLPRPNSALPPELTAVDGSTCASDNDCTEHPHGFCAAWGSPGGPPVPASCRYGCVTDTDCSDGTICICSQPVGQCIKASCHEDADCGDGMLCARWDASHNSSCGSDFSYECQKPDDECAVGADCPQGDFGASCITEAGAHVCHSSDGVVCGRPFLVDGTARLAALTNQPFSAPPRLECSLGGCSPAAGNATDLERCQVPPELRALVGQHWALIGLMEHASIAAFARFTLQLMHVGAPLVFLAASQRAMLDETEHAKTCFAIASHVQGRSVGPGKLPLADALGETELVDILRLTIREGCVGETLAAMEASEAAALAEQPFIASALRGIQSDELRHAELAWRFVQWALSQDDGPRLRSGARPLRDVVAEEFARALSDANDSACSTDTLSPTDRACARYGMLPGASRRAVRRAALRDVVAPCAAELLRRANALSPSCGAANQRTGAGTYDAGARHDFAHQANAQRAT